ncbi:MAG: hypothetical protein ACR2JP_06450 [Acidimicrobiia bacterium]
MRTVLAVLLVGALVGCSDVPDAAPEGGGGSTPNGAVAAWLEAVAAGDLATIDGLVDQTNLALVAGAENEFSVEQLAGVVGSGLPEAARRSYWRTFGEGLGDVLGAPLGDLTVAGADPFGSGDGDYAAVTVGIENATTEIITRLVDDRWQIDMVATVGPTLAIQIRRLVTDLAAGEDEDTARTFAAIAVDSLGAAHTRSPNRNLELELEAIESLPAAGED